MTITLPTQKFQVGQRVKRDGQKPFIIRLIYCTLKRQVCDYPICSCQTTTPDEQVMYSAGIGSKFFLDSELTLALKQLPYVPTGRRIISREVNGEGTPYYINDRYQPETDLQMAARHIMEQNEHDAEMDLETYFKTDKSSRNGAAC